MDHSSFATAIMICTVQLLLHAQDKYGIKPYTFLMHFPINLCGVEDRMENY